jgi:DNA-binding NarL/FixJ family response regulator
MKDSGPVRVVIVDDHPVVVDGLRASLESSPGFQVLGEAGSGEEALRRVDELHPDVVLMDLEMPGMGGLEAIRRLTRRHPEVAVLVLTMFDQDELVLSALRAGARGYILKGAPRDDVVRSITAVARGDAVFGGDVADRLLGMVASGTTLPTAFPELSDREREVLALLANGMSNGAIARRLALSPRTVANHVSNILPKVHATDRAQAVIAAREAGLGGLPAMDQS